MIRVLCFLLITIRQKQLLNLKHVIKIGVIGLLNSKQLPTMTTNVLPDNLPEGLSLKMYTTGKSLKNPTDYGVVLYIAYDRWYTAIACGTYNSGIWVSNKTNDNKWNSWVLISTTK